MEFNDGKGDVLWIADALRAEGCQVIETAGWRDRGHGDMSDIRGVLTHHTGGGGPNDWIVVRDGRPDLAGPLAQLTLELNGSFRVIAAGVCWHAGPADNQAIADRMLGHKEWAPSRKPDPGNTDMNVFRAEADRWQAPDNTDQIGVEYRSRNPVGWEIEKEPK